MLSCKQLKRMEMEARALPADCASWPAARVKDCKAALSGLRLQLQQVADTGARAQLVRKRCQAWGGELQAISSMATAFPNRAKLWFGVMPAWAATVLKNMLGLCNLQGRASLPAAGCCHGVGKPRSLSTPCNGARL